MNLSRKRTAIFCGFVLAAVFIQAGAQSAGPHGVGADKFGSPVTNAILTLRNPNGTVIRETGADNHGRFFFEGLAPGSYVMTISAFQFEPRRMIFEGPRYELPTVTIKLSPAPARGEITFTSNHGAVVEAENSAQIVSVRDQDLPSHQLSWM